MDTTRRPADELLDLVRVLLLLQGSILVATTIEALIWGVIFPGGGTAVLMSGVSAVVILVARTRLRADRRWARRLVYVVEGVTLAAITVDIALAIALTHAFPPVVALLTQLVLPLSVVTLLRRSAGAAAAPIPPSTVAALEALS
jgi:hypothetical protein